MSAACPGTGGATPAATRGGLRPHGAALGGSELGEPPPSVTRMDPPDGVTGVFRDALVVASLSHPLDHSSVCSRTFRVEDQVGAVPARLMLSPDGRVLIWRGRRLLVPNVEHHVILSGLRDAQGRDVIPHRSRFVPCDVFWIDPSG